MMKRKHKIIALYADENGNIIDCPSLAAAGRIGNSTVRLSPADLIPLPDGADLMYLPGRKAVGLDGNGEKIEMAGRPAAAVIPPGFTRTHLPAAIAKEDAPALPLYAYTAIAVYNDRLHVAAIKTDDDRKWNPAKYNTQNLPKLIKQEKARFPQSRLIGHLAHCALEYHCQTAQNIFYHRWEAGIPTSPACNAACLGCLSKQNGPAPSPQTRLQFTPAVDDIAAVAVYHLADAPQAIVSFGQGCEGEPSLAYKTIAPAITKIRQMTEKGQININTNAGATDALKAIIDAGLDSMRVSIISAADKTYDAYYRAAYHLSDVKKTIEYAMKKGVFVSLNLLYFPGLSDRPAEVAAWQNFLKDYPVPMIQMRNLNIDPDFIMGELPPDTADLKASAAPRTALFTEELKKARKGLIIGSFSHYLKK